MNVIAQKAIPLVKTYTPKQYKADIRNWSATEDEFGVKYFANSEGVLEFDGKKWRLIPVKGLTPRVLVKDDENNIFVCTVNDFGELKKDKQGKRYYHSLGDAVKHPEKPIVTIFNAAFIKNIGIFFQTQTVTYLYNPKTKSVRHWAKKGTVYQNFFSDGNFALLETSDDSEENLVISIFENNDFRPLQNLYDDNVMNVLHKEGKKILFLCRNRIYEYDLEKNISSPFSWEGAEWLNSAGSYCGTSYTDAVSGEKIFVLGSLRYGMKAFGKNGKIAWEYTPDNGAECTDVNELFTDAENNIWAANSCGITQILPSSGFLFKNKKHNITSQVYDFLKMPDADYIGTNNGLLRLKNDKIEAIENMGAQTWRLLPFGKNLLVANGNYGFHYLEEGKIKFQDDFYSASMLISRSKADTNLVYIGHYNGFRLAKFNGKTFDIIAEMPAMEKVCRSIVEMPDGNLWIAVSNSGFYRIRMPKEGWTKENFAAAKPEFFIGNLKDFSRCKLFLFDKKLLFINSEGIFTFQENSQKFEVFNPFGVDFSDKKYSGSSLHLDKQGRIWFLAAKEIFSKNKDGKWIKDDKSLALLEQKINAVFDENEFTHWIAGEDGLIRFDSRPKKLPENFSTLITSVRIGSDSIFYEGYGKYSEEKNVFPYLFNRIAFKFTSLSFFNENAALFSWKLDEFDENWSEWSPESQKEFTNLFEGNYTFWVKSKDIFGRETPPARFSFSVQPPWYREMYAYLGYGLLLWLGVQLLIKLNSRRLTEAKIRLEKIVDERTAEIKQKNVELEQQKEEIEAQAEDLRDANVKISEQTDELSATLAKVEEQHKDITASINYAKRIQSAVLPSCEKAKILGNHFILFRPRDIVSGDFYWLEELDDWLIWAAADCTGHGVPGAFMSLLGSEMLKEIILSKNIIRPDLILNALHLEVRTTLKQKENSSRDGMDIAVCAYHKSEKKLFYAGAHNPLVYVKNGNIEVIKADGMGIGGEQREQQRIFNLHEIRVNAPVWVYIFSDGYQDQFGGNEGRKFMSKNFRQLLLNISSHNGTAQKFLLEESFDNWLMRGKHKQIDDVLVIGVEIC